MMATVSSVSSLALPNPLIPSSISPASNRISSAIMWRSTRRITHCLRSSHRVHLDDPVWISASTSGGHGESKEEPAGKIGARVRVSAPLKVFHVPRVPEVDLTGMEGKLKQHVGLWKGKPISSNLPFKVEFIAAIEGRGPVKFFAHLKEDEFEYLNST